jgi:hypothetical protein
MKKGYQGLKRKKLYFAVPLLLIVTVFGSFADTSSTVEAYRQKGFKVKTVMPIFSQLVEFSLPPGFQKANEKATAKNYILELVLQGETYSHWTQMITVTGEKDLAINKPQLTPQEFAEGIAKSFKSECSTTFSHGKAINCNSQVDGFESFIVVLSCGSHVIPEGAVRETTLFFVIKGKRDFYTIQWAERGPASDSKVYIENDPWMERVKQILPIRLSPVIPPKNIDPMKGTGNQDI